MFLLAIWKIISRLRIFALIYNMFSVNWQRMQANSPILEVHKQMKTSTDLWHVKFPKMCSMIDRKAHLFLWQVLFPTWLLYIRPLKKWIIIRLKNKYLSISFIEPVILNMNFASQLWCIAVVTRHTHRCTQEQNFKERKEERKEKQFAD